MDWEEELKRQAAISALLAPPEAEKYWNAWSSIPSPMNR